MGTGTRSRRRRFAGRPRLLAAAVAVAVISSFTPVAGAAQHGLRVHSVRAPARASIIGGSAAAWPYVAFILYTDPATAKHYVCSGTVISSNVVLTAGHCAEDESTGVVRDAATFQVVTGTNQLNSSAQQLSSVSRVIVYPSYLPPQSTEADAALLVLSKPTTAPAVRLAGASDQGLLAPGTPGHIAGWGYTSYASLTQPTQLQSASTVIQDGSLCANAYSYPYDSSLEICALDAPSDTTGTCYGDSGGPLIAADSAGNPVEIGITSAGSPTCDTTKPQWFTRVDQIASWADGVIAQVAPAPSTPSLPTLSQADAQTDARQVLLHAFGRKFRQGHGALIGCDRRSSSRFACYVTWKYGANRYFGSVTVWLVSGSGGSVKWTDHYSITWENSRCSKHCKKHAKHGSA